MKIAVTGYNGRVGTELINSGCVPLECDITNVDSIKSALSNINPDVVINCASITAVDDCEDEDTFETALEVNYRGVENLRSTVECRLIHLSTDYIFSGKDGPYDENEDFEEREDGPVNAYGYTKWGGEICMLHPHKWGNNIIRTTGLFCRTDEHPDFVKKVIDTLSKGEKLEVTKSLHSNHTYVPHLVDGILNVVYHNIPNPVINIASEDILSRYEFALMIASIFYLDKQLLIPVTNSKIKGWVAKRPTKGGLKTNLAKKLGIPIYSTLDGLEQLRFIKFWMD